MRKESPLQKKEKKISWYEAKNNRIGSGEVWIAIAARFSGCFQCKDRLEKRVSTKRDGAVVSPRSFPRGGGGRGERVSTLLYFQQLVFLDDCVTFRSSRISIYFQPETSVPPFVLIHLLWMQRALVHLFPRNFVERATTVPPAALFIYRRICLVHRTGEEKTCDARRIVAYDRTEERGKVEVRSLETFRNL